MKYIVAAFILFSLVFLIHPANAASCSSYSSETSCKNADCTWCGRCGSAAFNQINNYAADKCVDSNLQCSYSCSTFCGSQCQSNADCQHNLTDSDCFYNGICSGCSCNYKHSDCPKNGTVLQANGSQTCYFGKRECSSTSGCVISTCQLRSGQVCDPGNGCVSCNQADCGNSGSYFEDYKCSGNTVVAKHIIYYCNGTACSYSKSDAVIEQCQSGCDDGKCREQLCSIQGTYFDCNKYDGYYGGQYCQGNDTYGTYRDYSCVSNECQYNSSAIKQGACITNQNTGATGGLNVVNNGQAATASNPNSSITSVTPPTSQGGRLYNGLFFGSNDITLDLGAQHSGYVNFTITKTNGLGKLWVQSGKTIFTASEAGSYSIPFENAGSISLSATSSGWVFFMPTVYDVRQIVVWYK